MSVAHDGYRRGSLCVQVYDATTRNPPGGYDYPARVKWGQVMNLYHPEPERRPEPRPNPGRALSFTVGLTLLLTFIILVAGARETFVASDAERVSFGGPGNFGILTEAMRVFEETAGVPLRPTRTTSTAPSTS